MVLLLLSIFCGVFAQPVDARIDKTIIRKVDVTGNGLADEIILHLKAKDMNSPFTWSLTILAGNKVIYSHKSDDASIDNNFKDVGYVTGCHDYISCKKKYYYDDILNYLILTGNKWYDPNGILDKSKSNTLYPLGRKQLSECCNITGSQANSILDKIERKLRSGKAVVLNIPESPVDSYPPMLFAPEVGRFLVIYEE